MGLGEFLLSEEKEWHSSDSVDGWALKGQGRFGVIG